MKALTSDGWVRGEQAGRSESELGPEARREAPFLHVTDQLRSPVSRQQLTLHPASKPAYLASALLFPSNGSTAFDARASTPSGGLRSLSLFLLSLMTSSRSMASTYTPKSTYPLWLGGQSARGRAEPCVPFSLFPPSSSR